MADRHFFRFADYAVFSLTILISVVIGVYYALSGGQQRTTSEYLLAGRQMTFLPVAISLFVSFESSIMMLGLPAETYMFGAQIFIGLVTNLLANLLAAWIVPPLMYPLKITSTYQYLELRFQSRLVRLLGSSVGIVNDLWYMGIVLFGPAVALKAVTGFPLWMSTAGLAIVAVIYTSIGGLKAVIWTDVFQTVVMLAGIFAVLIKGTMDIGGASNVWDIASRGGRMEFFKVVLFMAPAAFFVSTLASYEGIVSYVYYAKKECDPFGSKQLSDPNQIVPFIVMDIFGHLSGMPGLFVAALFSASLSTLSSCLSGQAALLWTDFIHPVVGDIPEWKATLIAKLSVVVFGVLACGIAWLISLIGGTLQQISAVILSSFNGPLVGIFFLGCFSPRTNAKGVLAGGIVSLAITLWLGLGMSFTPSLTRTSYLPEASIERCNVDVMAYNRSTSGWTVTQTTESTNVLEELSTMAKQDGAEHDIGPQGIEKLYTISYTLIPIISTTTVIVFGFLCSLLTGANKPGDVDPRYLLPLSDSFLVFLPKFMRRHVSNMGTQFINIEGKRKEGKASDDKVNGNTENSPMMPTLETTDLDQVKGTPHLDSDGRKMDSNLTVSIAMH